MSKIPLKPSDFLFNVKYIDNGLWVAICPANFWKKNKHWKDGLTSAERKVVAPIMARNYLYDACDEIEYEYDGACGLDDQQLISILQNEGLVYEPAL